MRRFSRRSPFITLPLLACLWMLVGVVSVSAHPGAFTGSSRSDPDSCFKTGSSVLLFQLRDTDNPPDGVGDTQVMGDEIEGETIYLQATLGFLGGVSAATRAVASVSIHRARRGVPL
jgi:hypothetical protein